MRMSKLTFAIATVAVLPACTILRPLQRGDGIAQVNPASVAIAPAEWDGRQVEMIGLLVWEPDNLGLYQSYGAYCRRGEQSAIHVDWSQWPGVSRADNRRRVTVRGVFRNRTGTPQPGSGVTAPSVAPGPAPWPGPGPLEPGTVVRWLSAPAKPCPPALP